MSLFDWLVVCHLVGDFLLQRKWQAEDKARGKLFNWALVSHCLEYSMVFLALVLDGKISAGWIGLVFVSHLILDRRVFLDWWMVKIKGMGAGESGWLRIVLDQAFHVLILVIIAANS